MPREAVSLSAQGCLRPHGPRVGGGTLGSDRIRHQIDPGGRFILPGAAALLYSARMTPDRNEPDVPAKDEDEFGLQDFRRPVEGQGLALDEFSEALVRMIDGGHDPYEPPRDAGDGERGEPVAEPHAAPDDGCGLTPRSILEAILFVGHPNNEPITSKQVAAVMRGVRPQEVDDLVVELNAIYAAEGCPYRVVSVGPGYRLALQEQLAPLRDKFYGHVREARLSQAAIDILAIVAYRQPLTREEIDALRGRPSGAVLSQLVRRQLLRVERGQDPPHKPRYCTTDRFLSLFGLESLAELPQSQDADRIF